MHLQRELRRIVGDDKFYLWEFIGPGWHYVAVRAGIQVAARVGLKPGDVIGYHVTQDQVFGGAMGDLTNIENLDPPYPDPFK